MQCPECNGYGFISTTYSTCKGELPAAVDPTNCPECHGFGEHTVDCTVCDGTGEVREPEDKPSRGGSIDESPSYRDALNDAGRGHLLR
jgi:DnaJ-class molecular chaperone